MIDQLKKLIEQSERIFITSHISPDTDAYCSTWLMASTLARNYPGKKVKAVLEDSASGLDEVNIGSLIEVKPVCEEVAAFKPNLFIMLDGNNYERFSRDNGPQLRSYLAKNKTKTLIIDHHEKVNSAKVDLYINRGSPATSQDVYVLLFEELGLKKPAKYENAVMSGILADTGRFLYQNKLHRETFRITSDLLDRGVNIEALTNKKTQFSRSTMQVVSELSKNLKVTKEYSYSFISDDFTRNWTSDESIKDGCEDFVNLFIRNIEGRIWGFLIYPDKDKGYGVSFRTLNGTIDVSKIAKELGGGGHKPAAGARIMASTAMEAIKMVQRAIAKTYPQNVVK